MRRQRARRRLRWMRRSPRHPRRQRRWGAMLPRGNQPGQAEKLSRWVAPLVSLSLTLQQLTAVCEFSRPEALFAFAGCCAAWAVGRRGCAGGRCA